MITPYFKYLDFLPKIPEELIESYEDFTTKGFARINNHKLRQRMYPEYPVQLYDVSDELMTWVNDLFMPYVNVRVSVHYLTVVQSNVSNKHRDVLRNTSFNYLINPGGNAITRMFDDDDNVIDTCKIDERRWCQLSFVDKQHDIQFLDYQNPRYSIVASAPKEFGHLDLFE